MTKKRFGIEINVETGEVTKVDLPDEINEPVAEQNDLS